MYVIVHPTFNREETIVKYSKTEIVKDVHTIKHDIGLTLFVFFLTIF